MKALYRGLFLVPLVVAVAITPAAAQSWKWDWGINGGYATYTAILDEEDTGLPDEAGSAEVHFKPGFLVGTQLTYWITPKLGLRANGRYADRPLEGSDISGAAGNFVTSVNLWGATADLMFRFKAPAEEYTKMEMLPYLALGFGAKWHNPAEDEFTCNDPVESTQYACGPFHTGIPARPRAWVLGEENNFAFLVGLGADWRLARKIAIRTEISDNIYKPKVYAAQQVGTSDTYNLTNGDDNQSAFVNELALQVGLHFLFGLAAPPVVAVAPPPAPPPPPPPPAPVTVSRESISVCVIDPTAPGGIRMQSATLVAGRDTVVVVGGSDRPLSESVGTITVASNAPWYVQGQPLTMSVGTGKVEFATYGSPRRIEAADLTYIGTVNGYPVYADRDDVADVISDLNELNRTRPGTDLGVLLNDNKELRSDLEDVKVYYVPMTATGCVFQAVQRQEEVRKGGK